MAVSTLVSSLDAGNAKNVIQYSVQNGLGLAFLLQIRQMGRAKTGDKGGRILMTIQTMFAHVWRFHL